MVGAVVYLARVWYGANLVIGDNGKLLEYRHLIANPKTKAVWAHSCGNKLGQLAQGVPGQNTGTNTIVFIHHNQVPRIGPRTSPTVLSHAWSDQKK
jgi:hypothetical protein